jgi:hypothetical protein
MKPFGLDIKWFTYHFDQPCFFKKHFGIECPGCGIQRSIYELLQGHVFESLKVFPALLPLLFMFAFLLVHLIFKVKHGSGILTILFIISIILITGNYLFKLTF